jgi:hypothetical protein
MHFMMKMVPVVVVSGLRWKTKGNQSYQGYGETDHHVSPSQVAT